MIKKIKNCTKIKQSHKMNAARKGRAKARTTAASPATSERVRVPKAEIIFFFFLIVLHKLLINNLAL